MRYTYRAYTARDGRYEVFAQETNATAAVLVGEIRDDQIDLPVCYCWSGELGRKITAALNAAHEDSQHLYPRRLNG